MFGSAWSLQDPVVTFWTFIPGLKVLLFEILQNGNFLWSSSKGLGMPLLGSEVQEAPLFPLTLALLWIPEAYYWNAFVILRWILLGSGAFLLAHRMFGLERTGALVFVLAFAFAFYHLRWVNHPYLNGIAAGVWYWYFLLSALKGNDVQLGAIKRRIPHFIGLVVSAYSVLTCGFPEASVTVATITLILGTVFLVQRLIINLHGVHVDISIITLAHLLAVALAAPQVLALIEFVGLSIPGHRVGYGLTQLSDPLPFFLQQLMWDGEKSRHGTLTHIWGLSATFLFFYRPSPRFIYQTQLGWLCSIPKRSLVRCKKFSVGRRVNPNRRHPASLHRNSTNLRADVVDRLLLSAGIDFFRLLSRPRC